MPTTTPSDWPALRVADWTETRDTLHMWLQVVGKVRLAHAPLLNHWWQVTLAVTPRGLTTGTVPHPDADFDVELDVTDHLLRVRRDDGRTAEVALEPKPTSQFHAELMAALDGLGLHTEIQRTPNEVEPAIPFAEDDVHASYDAEAVELFWRQLARANRALNAFRAHFVGKVSPVHFFWGAMDLACTRFSGRPAPEHPGGAPNCGDWVMVEGYSRELSSCGFWPGGGEEGAFYAYAYPAPEGFAEASPGPEGAFYSDEYRQFLLPYEHVRRSADPEATVAAFLQATYAAAADLGAWDRAALEDRPDRWHDRTRRDVALLDGEVGR